MHSERTATILLIEDDYPTAKSITQVLTSNADPQFRVRVAASREEALESCVQYAPDLIISDLTLRPGPDGNASQGLLLCKELRSITDVPILILSATARSGDKPLALNLGADDFLDKPFDEAELRSRSAALLRRGSKSLRLTYTPHRRPASPRALVVDPARQAVIMGDKELLLTPIELQLVTKLIESSGRIVSRREFAVAGWGEVSKADSQSIDMHVQRLRKKFQTAFSGAASIDTVRGAGYRLLVTDMADATS